MKSFTSEQFRRLFRQLNPTMRRQARAAYALFKADPFHPSLHFKRVSNTEPLYSARIGSNYRVLGLREPDDEIVWLWIGSHADYDKILKGRG